MEKYEGLVRVIWVKTKYLNKGGAQIPATLHFLRLEDGRVVNYFAMLKDPELFLYHVYEVKMVLKVHPRYGLQAKNVKETAWHGKQNSRHKFPELFEKS